MFELLMTAHLGVPGYLYSKAAPMKSPEREPLARRHPSQPACSGCSAPLARRPAHDLVRRHSPDVETDDAGGENDRLAHRTRMRRDVERAQVYAVTRQVELVAHDRPVLKIARALRLRFRGRGSACRGQAARDRGNPHAGSARPESAGRTRLKRFEPQHRREEVLAGSYSPPAR